ncbi:biopolymer transporter ExbB [Burkholderia cepacia JBK9]|uniref:MotA/TolQ/ExbB proton channel family protein n=1 Tax=Burkholderia arboris TaxID=488730 RepID=UPI0007408E0C|nr:MotA/TolQ/ExbB proton channel family protein [Burkholderia arboris]ALX15235.1 biopolymer transporter ExbB [Burkholderia cepacia JBK9]MCA8490761.1 MotA/TolQ/ExbB proton channel family protein [Burkholderia arboris]
MKKQLIAAFAASLMIAGGMAGVLVAPHDARAETRAAAAPATATVAALPAVPAVAGPAPQAAPAVPAAAANPYGLDALWRGGDFVARFVLILLVVMSMGSWYIMVTKFFEQTRANRRAKRADAQLWAAPSLAEGVQLLDPASPFRFIAETAIEAGEHHDEVLLEAVDRNTWVDTSVERAMASVSNRLQDGLAFLGTVGSTAPFVGLFGTVWGIYHALTAIGVAGQASIDKVAGPVGEALIMTAIGLAVAVPAVLGYNFLVRRNKAVMERVRAFGAQLHVVVLASGKRPVRDDARTPALID